MAAIAAWGAMNTPLSLRSLVWSALPLAAAALFTRRSVTAQVIARGIALSFVLPGVYATWLLASHGYVPGLRPFVTDALAALALVLAHPMLHHGEASRSFAPVALRSWFLASASAAVGSGIAFAGLGSAFAGMHAVGIGLALVALGAALVASGIGLVRMRGWSLVTGTIASLLAVLVAGLHGVTTLRWPILAATIPGAMMVGGVLWARLAHVPPPSDAVRTRVLVEADPLEVSEQVGEQYERLRA